MLRTEQISFMGRTEVQLYLSQTSDRVRSKISPCRPADNVVTKVTCYNWDSGPVTVPGCGSNLKSFNLYDRN